MDTLDAGQFHLRGQLGAGHLLLRVHLGLVDGPNQRQLARRAFLGGGDLRAHAFGGRGNLGLRLAQDAVRLPDGDQHRDEDGRAEEPLRLGAGLAGREQDEPDDRHDTCDAADQPPRHLPGSTFGGHALTVVLLAGLRGRKVVTAGRLRLGGGAQLLRQFGHLYLPPRLSLSRCGFTLGNPKPRGITTTGTSATPLLTAAR